MTPLFTLLWITLLFYSPTQSLTNQPRTEWFGQTMEDLREALKVRPNLNKAKNIILFLGDGMGLSTVTAARIYNAQNKGLSFKDAQLSFEKLPHGGLLRTHCVDRMVTDSAGGAAALLSGEKVNARTIGVNQNVPLDRCDLVEGNTLTSVLEHSHNAGNPSLLQAGNDYFHHHYNLVMEKLHPGKWTGIVTTARLTHASPAQAYGAAPNRNFETDAGIPPEKRAECKDLALQLVEEHDYIRVLLGGGRTKFLPVNTADPEYPDKKGEREDGRDLIQEWKDKKKASLTNEKYAYVQNKEEFDRADVNSIDYLLGMFENGHMKYEVDRLNKSLSKWDEPSLKDMTVKAIRTLQRSKEGYFLFVEGARIDHGHHLGSAFRALNDTVAFSDAIQAVLDMVDLKDTLVIATADHSHVFDIGGLTPINNPIFGLAQHLVGTELKVHLADDGLPFTVLTYANGPSWAYHHTDENGTIIAGRRNLTQDIDILDDPYYQQEAPVPLVDETHGGEDLGIYAIGPWAHLFTGTHENTYVAHVMMYAMCVGPGLTMCTEDPLSPPWPSTSTASVSGSIGGWLILLAVTLLMMPSC